MKATATQTTKVTVHIPAHELVEFIRAAGIVVPDHLAVDCYSTPFDTEDGGGIIVEWTQDHAEKQG